MALNGSHGTCVSCAESIATSGFKGSTENGRAGRGVYFWSYVTNRDIAKKLAVGWHQCANRAGAYSRYSNKSCAVLWAEIPVSKDAYMDFNDPNVEDVLSFLVSQARSGGKEDEPIDNQLLYKVHEHVIELAETALNCVIDVIRVRVAPPQKIDFIEKIYVGHPNCYVVRNGLERIKLVDVEHP